MEGTFILPCLVFFPMLGAGAAYLIGRKSKSLRDYAADFIVVLEFGIMLYAAYAYYAQSDSIFWDLPEFCGLGLHFTLDGFRVLYGLIACFMWMMTTIFSREYFAHYRNRNRYCFSGFYSY